MGEEATSLPEIDLEKVDEVVAPYLNKKGVMIPILQKIQEEYGYLPRPAMEKAARKLRIPISQMYGVATFYAQFHLAPRGRNIIRVCKGTACHIQGAGKISDRISEILGIGTGDTTEDLRFTLEEVACIGACALAPVMMINDDPHGRLTPDRIKNILDSYE